MTNSWTKKPNENDDQFIRRICAMKETIGTWQDVADILNISDKTVRNHISNVIQKLSVTTRYHALIELIKTGEINI